MRYLFNKGVPCYCVDGSEFNIKVTNTADLYLGERIAQKLQQIVPDSVDLTGKWSLVIEATGGIGSAITKSLEQQGASVLGIGSKDFDLFDFELYER